MKTLTALDVIAAQADIIVSLTEELGRLCHAHAMIASGAIRPKQAREYSASAASGAVVLLEAAQAYVDALAKPEKNLH